MMVFMYSSGWLKYMQYTIFSYLSIGSVVVSFARHSFQCVMPGLCLKAVCYVFI